MKDKEKEGVSTVDRKVIKVVLDGQKYCKFVRQFGLVTNIFKFRKKA